MTQKYKELLIQDLCARLPYGVKVKVLNEDILHYDYTSAEGGFIKGVENVNDGLFVIKCKEEGYVLSYDEFKSYLFPLSSMSEKQKEELNKKFNVQFLGNTIYSIHYHSEGYWDTDLELGLQDWLWFINWCYKNHFDYRGLIEKGLAIDATGLNIY